MKLPLDKWNEIIFHMKRLNSVMEQKSPRIEYTNRFYLTDDGDYEVYCQVFIKEDQEFTFTLRYVYFENTIHEELDNITNKYFKNEKYITDDGKVLKYENRKLLEQETIYIPLDIKNPVDICEFLENIMNLENPECSYNLMVYIINNEYSYNITHCKFKDKFIKWIEYSYSNKILLKKEYTQINSVDGVMYIDIYGKQYYEEILKVLN
jgi:hypothetical protein